MSFPVVASCLVSRQPLVSLPLYRCTKRGRPDLPHTWQYAIVAETLVLESDIPWLTQVRWFLKQDQRTSYAVRNERIAEKTRTRRLQLEVFRFHHGTIPLESTVDHRDRCGLHNFPSNLRPATRSQNQANRSRKKQSASRHRGIHWSGPHRKFQSAIALDWTTIHLGLYPPEIEAAYAYNHASKLLHGEFGVLNEIPPGSISDDRQEEIRTSVERRLSARGLL